MKIDALVAILGLSPVSELRHLLYATRKDLDEKELKIHRKFLPPG